MGKTWHIYRNSLRVILLSGVLSFMLLLSGCGRTEESSRTDSSDANPSEKAETVENGSSGEEEDYTLETKVMDVINDPVFGDYGRLIFPVDRTIDEDLELQDVGEILTWYNNVNPDRTVEIANYLKGQVESGAQIFYDIYTDEEKAEDPDKENTGLFFFRGEPNGKVAICNAGGGFVYVGAMQDSFPHALEISKRGYNAFALIYRPGAQTACEDLARAISFIFEHAEELGVSTENYSLWGGSAGARMAALLGTYTPAAFSSDVSQRAAAVIMQYTGHSEYSRNDPPAFACVGERDYIASWRVMQQRINALSRLGIDTEFHHYPGLGHGFGLGTGTAAEGWIDQAIDFWERQFR